ncbi:hypothetical protein EVAR_94484_1 [Eumeta japonica]|uniref:Uncharacterized protein n=1 Tax=Eumeta variegata TaxID=151549 RepID=A0A4C1UVZ5_EUMVA|nr:hypothetical protein EVAR_94484_1 [Eumeta japonica]
MKRNVDSVQVHWRQTAPALPAGGRGRSGPALGRWGGVSAEAGGLGRLGEGGGVKRLLNVEYPATHMSLMVNSW